MSILNSYFDKIFLITSPVTYEERITSINRLKEHNIDFQIVVSPLKDNFKTGDLIKQADCSLNSAYCSIFIDSIINNYNKICTFEDDIFLNPGFENILNEYFSLLNTWDILHLGYNPFNTFDKSNIFKKINKGDIIFGTHAMGFVSSTYKHMIKMLESNIGQPIDVLLYEKFYKDFNSYTLLKNVFLSSSYRSNELELDNYKFYKSSIE